MPGGFENSAMKNSFSLSSLQPPAGFPESPERARLRLERPYNSLTKKSRRDPEQEGWRRSWGSHNKDEFWAALQSDYDYLMDNNLIDTCKEASGDLSVYTHAASSDGDWSFNQFTAHFLELYSWLNSIQEAVYGKEETVTDRGLRTSHMERMQREGFRRRMFNEQSTRLLVRYPDLRDEVAWRVAHLNAKWETLELAMSPSTGASSQRDMCTDVEHEVRCLRKWVREMEARLQPLDFRAGINWTYAELEQRAKEHMVLQRDVESHGKIVSSVVKLCERVAQLQRKQLQQEQPQPRQHDVLRVARRLERRWHHLFLRSLEWQCHLETLATKLPPAPEPSHSDSDEGPASKQPRLSLSHSAHPGHEDEEQRRRRRQRAASSLMDTTEPPQPHHHPRTMVGASTGIKATIKRRRKQGGRPRGSPPPPPTDTMTAAELSAAPAPAMLTTGTAPDVNHNVTVVAATNNINNNKRTRNDNGRFSNRLDQSPNVAYYQFRYTDMDSDRQEHPGHSDHADDLSLDDDDDLLDEDLLDHPHDMAHDDNNNAHRGHLLSTASAGSLSDLAAGRPTEASASDTDEEWTYHAQVNGNVNGNANGNANGNTNGNTNGNLNGSRHFSENVSVPKMSPMRSSKECIQRLVNQAEQLVRCGAQAEDLPRAPETTLVSPAGPPLRAGGAARCFEPLRLDGSLVAGTAKRSAKLARTKQWLKLHSEPGQPQPPDSCDASGEYTEDSSDEDPASVSSEDVHNCSVATYREVTTAGCSSSVSGSNEAILDQDTPGSERAPRPPFGLGMGHSDSGSSKVVLRNKRRGLLTGERPWSVSGLPQLMAMSVGSLPTGGAAGELSQFSISESALHQLAAPGSATAAGKADGMEMMASSSTVEESVAHTTCAGSSSGAGSLRRRKMRSRKRTQSRRCDSGSDGVYPLPDSPAQRTPPSRLLPFKTSSPLSSPGKHAAQRPGGIVKSGSFSGTPAARASSERLSCSDPAAHRRSARVVSSTETDEDDKSGVGVGASPGLPVPVFRLGPEEGGISVAAVRARRRAGAILGTGSDVEKLSIHSTEQASWDSYQEKYLSEPYSEDPPDPEAARRLLDWDDYRTFLDSQSDCASSLSTNPNNGSPAVHRRRIRNPNGLEMEEGDSDTDLEDLRQRIQQSQTQYAEHEKMFETELASVASSIILGKDYADFLQTCSENCRCLNAILEDVDVRSRLTPQERRDIAGLANSWSTLQDRAQELLRLKKEMDALKDDLLKSRGVALSSELGDMDQLDERIRLVKAEHESLQERKKLKLPYLNHAVHRFRQQALKEQVAELYGIYDDTLDMVSQHLSDLQQTKVAWQQFEQHLAELQRALRSDQDTLKQVDRALQGGQVSTAVASSVREVARALSEKQEHSSVTMGQSSLVVLADAQTAALRCSEGGSLSDSGISDTGSDQEPSERERRLANLRRLARQLEAVLGPGSRALDSMREKIQQTESELRGLQRTCRDLIVRTAVCVGAASRTGAGVAAAASGVAQPCLERVGGGVRLAASSRASPEPLSRTHRGSNGSAKWRKSRKRGLREADEDPEDPEDPEAGKARPRHWLWRAMRAALPFQVAIMALLCVACLLEPHCCDAINNLNLSLSPQLRYVRGPPPV